MRHKVFLSYARGDETAAQELRAELRDVDLAGWMDESDIASGDVISQKIKEALESASVVVVLLSERSLKSPWVQFELGAAFGLGKRIVPVFIGRKGGEQSLPDLLRGTMYLDARDRPMNEVAGEVARVLEFEGRRLTKR